MNVGNVLILCLSAYFEEIFTPFPLQIADVFYGWPLVPTYSAVVVLLISASICGNDNITLIFVIKSMPHSNNVILLIVIPNNYCDPYAKYFFALFR